MVYSRQSWNVSVITHNGMDSADEKQSQRRRPEKATRRDASRSGRDQDNGGALAGGLR